MNSLYWIDTKERLPDTNKEHDTNIECLVLVKLDGRKDSFSTIMTFHHHWDSEKKRDCYTWLFARGTNHCYTLEHITHWTHIPSFD